MNHLTLDDYARLSELYDASLAWQDLQLRRLLTSLEQLELLENTLVVITADHGENLGDHQGLVSHIFSLHQSLLHVPLLVRYPAAFGQGTRIPQPVGTVQVPATILSTLGLEPLTDFPPLPRAPEPSSVLPLQSFDDPPVDELSLLVMAGPGTDVRALGATRWSIQNDKWKLTRTSEGTLTAIDLESDPGERAPVPMPEDAPAKQMLEMLDSAMTSPSVTEKTSGVLPSPVDPATQAALKAMGYLR
jgi:arylsulfatase A-like enzyme